MSKTKHIMKKALIYNVFQQDERLKSLIENIHQSTDAIVKAFENTPVLTSRLLSESATRTKLLTNLDTIRESATQACLRVNEQQLLETPATCLSTIWYIVDIQKSTTSLREKAAIWLRANTPASELEELQKLKSSHHPDIVESIVNSHSAVLGMMKGLESLINQTVTEILDETSQFHFEQYNLRHKVEQLVISYAIEKRDACLHKLKSMAQDFKANRSDKLDATHWGKMMEDESKSYTNSDINPDIKKHLKANNTDEELWTHKFFADFEEFHDAPYLNLLNNDNIMKFCELILRRNLIQCEMFPNLNAELEAWLNPQTTGEATISADQALTLVIDEEMRGTADRMVGQLCKCTWANHITQDGIRNFTYGILGIDTQFKNQRHRECSEKFWEMINHKTKKIDGYNNTLFYIIGYLWIKRHITFKGNERQLSRQVIGNDTGYSCLYKMRNGYITNNFKETIDLVNAQIDLHLTNSKK